MKQILLLGAGRSAASLIKYLQGQLELQNWALTIGDVQIDHLQNLAAENERIRIMRFDIFNEAQVNEQVAKADLVISMLPATLHGKVAAACLQESINLLTASYVSPEINQMHEQAQEKGLTFLMECGLDPGIDHMSAMKVIDELKEKGAELTSFKSYTGGLIAPASDTNPWHYKITWNPRNVVLAGQGTAKYLKNGEYKYIPYYKLFQRTDEFEVLDYGKFDGYANRDSLSYRAPYGLQNIPTILRGTLRRKGYCQSWDVLVKLGLTDDSFTLVNGSDLTYKQFTESFIPASSNPNLSLKTRLADYLNLDESGLEIQNLEWLGLLSDEKINLENPSPAKVIEKLLVEKLKLEPGDKDMIVMQHLFEYKLNGKEYLHKSSLVVLGEDTIQTGMAKTVGLPLGIAAKLLLQDKIGQKGVVIPISKELYDPILTELEQFGINFIEEVNEKEPAV